MTAQSVPKLCETVGSMKLRLDYGLTGLFADFPDDRTTVIEPAYVPAGRRSARDAGCRPSKPARQTAIKRARPARPEDRHFGLRHHARATSPGDARSPGL